jgi:hypothetical protein
MSFALTSSVAAARCAASTLYLPPRGCSERMNTVKGVLKAAIKEAGAIRKYCDT